MKVVRGEKSRHSRVEVCALRFTLNDKVYCVCLRKRLELIPSLMQVLIYLRWPFAVCRLQRFVIENRDNLRHCDDEGTNAKHFNYARLMFRKHSSSRAHKMLQKVFNECLVGPLETFATRILVFKSSE